MAKAALGRRRDDVAVQIKVCAGSIAGRPELEDIKASSSKNCKLVDQPDIDITNARPNPDRLIDRCNASRPSDARAEAAPKTGALVISPPRCNTIIIVQKVEGCYAATPIAETHTLRSTLSNPPRTIPAALRISNNKPQNENYPVLRTLMYGVA
jgi:hypothetical protein